MYLKVNGLVLRTTTYNDTDALLTLLTDNYGKLTVKARGLRKKNSPLVAPCQLLAFGEFTLFEYKGMYTINEARSLELFSDLRRDLQKLSLGTYFAQVAEVICQEDIPNPELQSLVLNCLYALCKLNYSEKHVKATFELRIACLAGYTPDLTGCYHCGKSNADRLNISEGVLICSTCRGQDHSGIHMPISSGALECMRYICSCDPQKILSYSAGEDTIENLAQITESYLSAQLERGFSTLDFYKSLIY